MKFVEKFNSRGIGSEWGLTCFVSGSGVNSPELKPNISAFVESKEAGENIVQMFNGLASLDFRPSEPNWIQVKVGVTPDNIRALEALDKLVRENDNVISTEIIEAAKQASILAPN